MTKRQNSSQSNSHNSKSRNVRGIFLRIFFYIYTLAFLGISTHILFVSGWMNIDNLSVTGADRVGELQVRKLTESILDQNQVFDYPTRHFFFVDIARIESAIQKLSPLIEDVHVRKIFPKTIRVEVSEYGEIFALCEYIEVGNSSQIGDKCNVLYGDSESEILDANDALVQDEDTFVIYVPKLRLNSGEFDEQIKATESVSEKEGSALLEYFNYGQLQNIKDFVQEIPFEAQIYAKDIPRAMSAGSGHILMRTDEGWDIMYNSNDNPFVALDVLQAFLSQNKALLTDRVVEYVDIRILDKIFVQYEALVPTIEAPLNEDEESGDTTRLTDEDLEFSEDGEDTP